MFNWFKKEEDDAILKKVKIDYLLTSMLYVFAESGSIYAEKVKDTMAEFKINKKDMLDNLPKFNCYLFETEKISYCFGEYEQKRCEQWIKENL